MAAITVHLGEVLSTDDDTALVGAPPAVAVVGAGVLEGVAATGGRREEDRRCCREPECASQAHGCTTFCVPRRPAPRRSDGHLTGTRSRTLAPAADSAR